MTNCKTVVCGRPSARNLFCTTLAIASFAVFSARTLRANETWTIDVADGATRTISDALGAGTNIVKTGKGKLIVIENAGSAAFNGTVTIEAGELEAQSTTAVGGRSLANSIPVFGNRPANTIIIKNGARFIGTFAKPGGNDQVRPILANNIELEGSGPDGKGALVANSPDNANIDHFFAGSITLTGDARITQQRQGIRWGLNGVGNQTVTLNGHTLTIDAYQFVFDGMIYDAGEGGRVVFSNSRFSSTDVLFLYGWLGASRFIGDGTLALHKGCILKGWGGNEAPTEIPMSLKWKVNIPSGGQIQIGKGWMTLDGDVTLGDLSTGTTTVGKYGDRKDLRTTFKGNISGVGILTKGSDSEMVVSGACERAIGQLNFTGGSLTLHNAGLLMVTNQNQCLIDGALAVRGQSAICFGPKGVSTWTGQSTAIAPASVYVRHGLVDIDGGVVTAKVNSAVNKGNDAAFYLRGDGELAVWGGPANDAQFAQNGSTYIGQEGGRLIIKSCASLVGRYSTSGAAVYEMKDGEFTLTPDGGNAVSLMRGSTNAVTALQMTAGTIAWTNKNGLYEFKLMSGDFGSWSRNGGRAIVTLAGSNATVKAANVNMSHKKDDAVATLNLNAGTLEAGSISHRYEDDAAGGHANTRTFVNFGGGAFKLNADSDDIFGATAKGSVPVSRVTVYAGGATIDTAGHDATVKSVPLSAPEGQGLATIALPSAEKCVGYRGAPLVTITGDGEDATAFCAYDRATGKIGPITVTSPGRNYTAATASILWTNGTTKLDLDVTLAPQTAGGLTKRGAGTLTLACANGSTGTTTVEGGTLALTAEGSCPSGATLAIPAASLATRERSVPVVRSAITQPFAEIRITGADDLDEATFGRARTLVEAAVAPAAWPAVKLIAKDGSAIASAKFQAYPGNGGKSLRFGPVRGLRIIVR